MSRSFSDNWEGFSKATAKANRLNKTIVFDALLKAGITRVCVGFDGEGDQGQMERASAQTNGKTAEFPAVNLTLWVSQFGSAELSTRELDLQEAVEHLCYGHLEERHGGWENDGGSFGEFTFDVAARTVTLDFNGRFVDCHHSTHKF